MLVRIAITFSIVVNPITVYTAMKASLAGLAIEPALEDTHAGTGQVIPHQLPLGC